MSKHTPGPWRVVPRRHSPEIVGADNLVIALMVADATAGGVRLPEEQQANAALISASPGLLAALRKYAYAASLPYGDPLHKAALADADAARLAATARVDG